MEYNHNNASLNPVLLDLDVYTSKAISEQAKKVTGTISLSIGEPKFGPPNYLFENIVETDLSIKTFVDSVKRYEDSQGSFELRQSISTWYMNRYGLDVDPNTQIMITHGGVEAITLAIMCTTQPSESVGFTNPSYMLYERTIQILGRTPYSMRRPSGSYEYETLFNLVITHKS